MIEIELKFLLPMHLLANAAPPAGVSRTPIRQYYLSWETLAAQPEAAALLPPEAGSFDEWRVRGKGARYFMTGKKALSAAGQRLEHECELTAAAFEEVLSLAQGLGPLRQVEKERLEWRVERDGVGYLIHLDLYHAVGGAACAPDFFTCEVEFEAEEAMTRFAGALAGIAELTFLQGGLDVTGQKAFSNKRLAEKGFPASDFAGLRAWLEDWG